MNFREEYKKSIEIMSPSAEQLERMKKNILEQAKAPEKKAIPFKKIACIGGAVAACAVISVAAINIIPRLGSGSAGLTAESSASAAADMAEGESFTADLAMDAEAAYEGFSTADTATEAKSENTAATTIPAMDDKCAEVMEDAEAAANDETSADIVIDSADDTFAPSVTTGESIDEPAEDAAVDFPATDEAIDEPVADEAVDIPVIDEADDVLLDEPIIEEPDFTVELSEDYSVVIINNEKYTLVDDGSKPHGGNVTCNAWTASDGTEYWIERHDDGYMRLWFRDTDGLSVIGGYSKSSTARESLDEPRVDTETDPAEAEPAFELSDDLGVLIYNDTKYVLQHDEASVPVDIPIIECMNAFDANGTEYWLDFSSEEYLVLSRDNGNGGFDIVGGYTKAE